MWKRVIIFLIIIITMFSCTKAIKTEAVAKYEKGELSYKKEDFYNALNYFKEVAEIEPNYPNIYNKIFESYVKYGYDGDEKAYLYFKIVEKKYPENINLLLCIGKACQSMFTKREEALIYYNKVIQIDPKNIEAYLLKADLHNILNFYDDNERYLSEIECYNKILEIDSENAEAYYQLGEIYLAIGEYEMWKKYNKKAAQFGHKDAIILPDE